MTCMAALRTTNSILMGGDSAGSDDGFVLIISEAKVFHQDDYILGAAGPARVAQILRYDFHPPMKIRNLDWHTFMVRDFVGGLKEQTKLGSLGKSASLLVATKGGGIFEISSDFAVCQSRDEFAAIGSGASYALGSMYSSSGDPRSRLRAALEAAAHFDAFVRAPFEILELPEEGLKERWAGVFEPMPDRSYLFAPDPDDRGGEDDDSH